MTSFADARAAVDPVDAAAAVAARDRHGQLTKPAGSLGRLEDVGIQLAAITGQVPPAVPRRVTIGVFAADHGVVAEGVTAWPQEVTAQMVANFAGGGAAINVLGRQLGADIVVVDVGVATELPVTDGIIERRVRSGTRNLAESAAMTFDEMTRALDVGAAIAAEAVAGGAQLLVTGEMGIGNTTAATALIVALTGSDPTELTGPGAGADTEAMARKVRAIERGVARLGPDADPLTVLAEVGGLEIAALVGFITAGAAARVPVVLDGVIAVAAGLVAIRATPEVVGYLVAGHRSSEPAATAALSALGLSPLVDLGLRLGEGSGAALAVPIVQAAAHILDEMATFDSAGVTSKDPGT
jgi:nicotinate-nucleotide--dimethylbenzimidazole phosphoribosyltransferase